MNFISSFFSPQFLFLISIFIISILIQLFYYLGIFSRIIFKKAKREQAQKIPVSVIICAKNEAENLKTNLPAVLEQDYPEFEVIVVNDCSEDDTEMLLSEFKKKYPNLKTSTINKDKKFTHGKKLAITIGIKAAQNEWMLFTDADCKPVSREWIWTMHHNFTTSHDIVLGYGGFYPRKGLLDKFIRYDTVFIAMQYLGLALAHTPYMGVGRNMAYRKSVFFRNKGFSSHNNILSGDDDLFINEVANNRNTGVELDRKSFTRSKQKNTWRTWLYQKRRHLSTAGYYKRKYKLLLGMELFSRFIFYVFFLILMLININITVALCLFGIRLFVQLVTIKSVMNRLNEKYLLLISPLMDIIMPLINLYLMLLNYFGTNRNRWK